MCCLLFWYRTCRNENERPQPPTYAFAPRFPEEIYFGGVGGDPGREEGGGGKSKTRIVNKSKGRRGGAVCKNLLLLGRRRKKEAGPRGFTE